MSVIVPSSFDVDRWIAKLTTRCEHLTEAESIDLCDRVKLLLAEESNVQPVSSPVTLVGDIHGQFYDLLELFRISGRLPETAYVFMGDYVDRGHHSVETAQLLFCYKLRYPDRITLIRGNHESRSITQTYGFYDECLRKYGSVSVWRSFTETFDFLTLSAVVDGRVLAVHGGLSPEVPTLDDIRKINRNEEIPAEGPFADLLWSDPEEIEGWGLSERGAGWIFGSKPTSIFCHLNGLELIARAHQLVMEGFQYRFADRNLITVWSAPNYFYRMKNTAAVLKLHDKLDREVRTFTAVAKSAETENSPDLEYFL